MTNRNAKTHIVARRCTATAAIAGAVLGLVAALIGWVLVAANLSGGVVNVSTLGHEDAFLAGNVLALCVSPILCVAVSCWWPQVRCGVISHV